MSDEWTERRFLEYRIDVDEMDEDTLFSIMADFMALDAAVAITSADQQIIVMFEHEVCGVGLQRAEDKTLPVEWSEVVLPTTVIENWETFGYETRDSLAKRASEDDIPEIKPIEYTED